MKKLISIVSIVSAMAISNGLAEIGQENHGNHSMPKKQMTSHGEHYDMKKMTPEMQKHVNEVYSAYLSISTALAGDDYTTAKKGVLNLVEISDKAPVKHKESKHHQKMMGLIHSMHSAGDIEALRSSFQTFSEKFIIHMKSHKMALSKDFKVFYCPMKKGRWVQDKAGTNNPYYGASMLTCGGEEK